MGEPDRSGRRRPVVPVAVGAVGLLALGTVQAIPLRQRMEDDLTARSAAALQRAGVPAAEVTFAGRDATLRGVAAPDVDRALSAVRGLDGVRVAQVAGARAPTPPPAGPTAPDGPTTTDGSTTPAGPTTTGGSSPTATPSASRTAAPEPTPTASRSPLAVPTGPFPARTGPRVDPAAVQAALDRLGPLTFPRGSSTLTPRGRAAVERMARVLVAAPVVRLRVEGHTDDRGGARVNRGLSYARARTVRLTLQAHGVQRSRLRAVGLGEGRPEVPNTSEQNRARNRRVEVRVLRG